MNEIIGRFDASKEVIALWRKAADTWRLPYWDWTTEHVPTAVRTVELNIVAMPMIGAEEFQGKLDNPLGKFTNPLLLPMGHESLGRFKIPLHNDEKYGKYPV